MDSPSNNSKVLLVEGQDDKHVVRHLCYKIGLEKDFCIRVKGNIDELLDAISLEIKAPGLNSIGIVADANDDLDARWRAVSDRFRDRLREADIKPPDAPSSEGTIIDSTPRIGVWLMPDNRSPGELEDFVQTMIPAGDPVWPRSRQYIDGIPDESRKFIPKKKSRAELYAWLATRKDPKLMGAAIGAEDLWIDGALCTSFAAWMRRLFRD